LAFKTALPNTQNDCGSRPVYPPTLDWFVQLVPEASKILVEVAANSRYDPFSRKAVYEAVGVPTIAA